MHELRLNIGPHTDGARGAQAHERYGEGVLARVHAEVIGQQVGDLGRVGDVARGFLNAHDVGVRGQALYVALADAAAAAAGDVVQDAGDVHGVGHGLKVLVDALLVGLVVVGGNEQQAVGAQSLIGERLGEHGLRGVGARAGNDGTRPATCLTTAATTELSSSSVIVASRRWCPG